MEESNNNYCLHGQWKEGVCLCKQGYISEFPGSILYPLYCDKEQEHFVKENTFGRISILHYSAMAFLVGLTAYCFIAFVSLLYIIWNTSRLKKKIEDAEKQLLRCETLQKKRDLYPLLHAEIWVLPVEFTCINEVKAIVEEKKVLPKDKITYHAKVLYPYKPQDKDELHLRYPGDVITDVVELELGWCKGKLNGKTGFFPLAYTKLYDSARVGSTSESISSDSEVLSKW